MQTDYILLDYFHFRDKKENSRSTERGSTSVRSFWHLTTSIVLALSSGTTYITLTVVNQFNSFPFNISSVEGSREG